MENAGTKTTNVLYDSTAVVDNRDLAAAIQGALTNPAQSWINMTYQSPEMSRDTAAGLWLEQANNICNRAISESNFGLIASHSYQAYTGLGNMPIILEADYDNGKFERLRFETPHLADIVWTTNAHGVVDSFWRRICYSVEQAYELFGDNAAKDIHKLLEADPDKEILFLHCVFRRDPEDVKYNSIGLADPLHRPYASFIVNTETQVVVKEDGYYEFPLFVGRFDVRSGELYGRGPAHIALPDIRSLNQLRKEELSAAAYKNRPPLIVMQRDLLSTLDIRPGGIIQARQKDTVTPMNLGMIPGVTAEDRNQLAQQIHKAFYIDKIMLPPRTEIGEMSAFEVRQRSEEIIKVFGPTIGRLIVEVLQPLAVRAFNIMFRAGAMPQLPPQLQKHGVNVDIKFINQFAKAQQFEDVSNILSFTNELAALAQINPAIVDNFDFDAGALTIAKIRSIPESMIRDSKQVEAERQQRAEQMQQQQQLDAGIKTADMYAKMKGNNPGV